MGLSKDRRTAHRVGPSYLASRDASENRLAVFLDAAVAFDDKRLSFVRGFGVSLEHGITAGARDEHLAVLVTLACLTGQFHVRYRHCDSPNSTSADGMSRIVSRLPLRISMWRRRSALRRSSVLMSVAVKARSSERVSPSHCRWISCCAFAAAAGTPPRRARLNRNVIRTKNVIGWADQLRSPIRSRQRTPHPDRISNPFFSQHINPREQVSQSTLRPEHLHFSAHLLLQAISNATSVSRFCREDVPTRRCVAALSFLLNLRYHRA